MRVRWKSAALKDLAEIAEHIADENTQAARRVVSEIRRQSLILSRHSEIGRAGRVAGTRELVITKFPYVIAYEETQKFVDILAVVHASKLWPDFFSR
jgi:addiction module RelE/StbE family toxin